MSAWMNAEEVPEAVLTAAETAKHARRTWLALPEDRDHAARHAAADEYDQARRALVREVEKWIEC